MPTTPIRAQSAAGLKFEKLSHHESLAHLDSMMNYAGLRAEQKKLREKGIYRGIGFASFIEVTNPSAAFYGVGGARITSQDGATVKLDAQGNINVATGVTEQGQGAESVVAQCVATSFGVSIDKVRVITGDTDVHALWRRHLGFARRRHRRRSGLAGRQGPARQRARGRRRHAAGQARDARHPQRHRRRCRRAAPNGCRWRNWRASPISVPTRCLPASRPNWWRRAITCRARWPFAFTNGVQASYLEVDTDTGFVKLLKHWCVEDCGTIINPQLVDEQIRGGIVQGIGAALFEQCLYDERGQMLNGNMADYLVPMAAEMPDIECGHVVSPTADSRTRRQGRGRSRHRRRAGLRDERHQRRAAPARRCSR